MFSHRIEKRARKKNEFIIETHAYAAPRPNSTFGDKIKIAYDWLRNELKILLVKTVIESALAG